jgi:hypothetical protein
MPNVNRVNGFRPSRYLSGAPWNGKVNHYYTATGDSVALFVGDLVKLSTTGDAEGKRTVVQAAAGDACVGVVVGFVPDYANLNAAPYRLASTRRVVMVADDPNLLFEAQEDGDTDPLETADIGLNVEFIVAAGNTTTGQSGMQIDSTSHATDADHSLKLMGVKQSPDNEFVTGGQAFTRWEVKINNHQLASGTGTAGV